MAISYGDFAAKHWGRQPLLSSAGQWRAAEQSYVDLLSLDTVDELLSRRGLRTPFIRIAKDGKVVDPKSFTGAAGVGAQVRDQVADDRVLELFADGHTVVLQGLHRVWPPLIDFAGALSSEVGHPVQVNAYLTPSSSSGFAAHYDVHDVFVLQVAGKKRWRIHEPVHPDPLRTQPWEQHRSEVAQRAAEPPTIDATLHPGDSLYLPRGYVHSGEATDDISLHLTVGIHPLTRFDLVEAMVELLADAPELRPSLRLEVDAGSPEQLATELSSTVAALVERIQAVAAHQVAPILTDRLVSATRPAPLSPLAQATAVRDVTPQTVLRVRAHLRHRLTSDGQLIKLSLPGRQLELPVKVHTALSSLLSGAPHRVGELAGLDQGEAVELARLLLRAGVLVPDDFAPGPS